MTRWLHRASSQSVEMTYGMRQMQTPRIKENILKPNLIGPIPCAPDALDTRSSGSAARLTKRHGTNHPTIEHWSPMLGQWGKWIWLPCGHCDDQLMTGSVKTAFFVHVILELPEPINISVNIRISTRKPAQFFTKNPAQHKITYNAQLYANRAVVILIRHGHHGTSL